MANLCEVTRACVKPIRRVRGEHKRLFDELSDSTKKKKFVLKKEKKRYYARRYFFLFSFINFLHVDDWRHKKIERVSSAIKRRQLPRSADDTESSLAGRGKEHVNCKAICALEIKVGEKEVYCWWRTVSNIKCLRRSSDVRIKLQVKTPFPRVTTGLIKKR